MKSLVFFYLLFACLNSSAQQPVSCACKGFVDSNYVGIIHLKDTRTGKSVQSIPYKHKKGNYLLFDITQAADSFFFVKMRYAISGNSYEGWIKKSKYLVTFLKQESLEIPLLYEASYTSKIKTKIPTKSFINFQIFNCTQNWVYIKGLKRDSKLQGWIHSQNQCINPLANCD